MNGLLNISEAMSIAVHTCVWLGVAEGEQIPANQIAEALGFSSNHLSKVARKLVQEGILSSERGPNGGLMLARPLSDVSIMDLYLSTGGRTKKSGCLLKSNVCDGRGCILGQVLAQENKRLVDLFTRTMLDEVVKSFKLNKCPSKRKGECDGKA